MSQNINQISQTSMLTKRADAAADHRAANAKGKGQYDAKDYQHNHEHRCLRCRKYRLQRVKTHEAVFLFNEEKDQVHDPDVRKRRRYFRIQSAAGRRR